MRYYENQETIMQSSIFWQKRIDIINKIELDFGDYLMDMFDLSLSKADELTKKAN